ncbi:MAG: ABC-F family ATP-binding cassette domain-containing protein [Rubrobacter sp.]|nr:ABC-F family ATP-binding cassette domain-containing protein [Rubrobacter sp.]
MKVLIANDLVKYHGGDLKILSGASLSVEAGEKLGLVGRNGVGKTSLLRLLAGHEEPDGGSIDNPGGSRVALTNQSLYAGPRGEVSVEEEIFGAFSGMMRREQELADLAASLGEGSSDKEIERYGRLQTEFERDGGYSFRARAASTLTSLGFDPDQWKRPVGSFSGGEQSRVALARMLLEEPDLVLLDEPTNHLDLRAIEWLEEFIKSSSSAVLVVSHDRYFLDSVCGATLDLEDGRIERYTCGYTSYVEQRKAADERLARKAKANAERRAQLERFVEKNRAKARKSSQAKNKQKQLDRMEKVEGPRNGAKNMKLDLGDTKRAGRVVMELATVGYGYEANDSATGSENGQDVRLLDELSLVVERGERVAMLGPNGMGKSTVMRLATGEITPGTGRVSLGHNVKPAYQDQQLQMLDESKSVLQEAMSATGFDRSGARDLLGAFLFTGEEVFKKVSALSGGEKRRLSLAEIVASDSNLLLLDEPTNDLDIPSREALEEALANYGGTIFFISHDRYFLRRLATRVVELENKQLTNYLGGYDYYRSHRRLDESGRPEGTSGGGRKKPRRRVRPGMNAEQNVLATRLVAVEGEIDATERRISRLEKELATSETYSDAERSRKVVTEHRELKDTLETLYEDWTALMEEAEEADI